MVHGASPAPAFSAAVKSVCLHSPSFIPGACVSLIPFTMHAVGPQAQGVKQVPMEHPSFSRRCAVLQSRASDGASYTTLAARSARLSEIDLFTIPTLGSQS